MRLPKTSLEEYALSLRAEGQPVFRCGDFWWRQVRPCFFRPVLPFLEFAPDRATPPWRAGLGGFQHVVPNGTRHNSSMSFLMFPEAHGYSDESLRSSRRSQIRTAARFFSVRVISSRREFTEKAHDVYIDFYSRTRYRYLSKRQKRDHFERWTNAIFDFPACIVLGAFSGERLSAVSIFRVVGNVLVYSVFFATGDGMRQHVSSLMLHSVRSAAAESGDIDQIYVGMCKTGAGRSIDEFYLQRGCTIQTKPATLSLNPLVSWGMRCFCSNRLQLLTGKIAL